METITLRQPFASLLCRRATLAAIALVSGAAFAADAPPAPAVAPVPAGTYTLDKPHSTLLFKLSHLGFSRFTARFARFDANLRFDPAMPTAATLEVNVDPRSITTDNAPAGFLEALQGARFLDVERNPTLSYRSTAVTAAGPGKLRVVGDFTLHGVTKPLVLDVSYNGGYAGIRQEPRARIGFSAQGTFKRSDYGIGYGVPAPGTTMGVGDDIDLVVEVEFTGPPMASAASAATAR